MVRRLIRVGDEVPLNGIVLLHTVRALEDELFVESPGFEFSFQPFREPYAGKGGRVCRALARKLA